MTAREGAQRVAIANGGTIPDRGLYTVFLVGPAAGRSSSLRVGELDEEMVFETHVGETFVLGASSWRVEAITHDRVLVSPAPGMPGRMPFWKGDRPGRPLELGLAIGKLTHDLLGLPPAAAVARLTGAHDLQAEAAEQLLQYLRDQLAAARAVPDATTVLIERVRDELGDWRVCLLSPRGGRIHAPWAMAVTAHIREQRGIDVETLWGDDGFVVRFPDMDEPPDPAWLLPDPDDVQALVVRELGGTALFAAKFRENAARSLLLPKRRPGTRAPLWQQRKRAADLLAVAARYGSFPVLLETYRECLRDVFDMPALASTLGDIRSRTIRVATVDSDTPSPFAASLLFSYVASFLYDGDAPLAERRAQALLVDQSQLRELIGDAELRDLIDFSSMTALEEELQRLAPHARARSVDSAHDMLLAIGDLTGAELRQRLVPEVHAAALTRELLASRRAVIVRIAGDERYIAVEDAARLRDALGVPLPPGIPRALLESVRDPLGDLARRFARTHAPFPTDAFAARYALTRDAAEAILRRLRDGGRLVPGEFRPGASGPEWTDAGVLRLLRRRSLARLRHEVEPVDQVVLGRLTTRWHGTISRRQGVDALLDVIEQLQGMPLPASLLETEILPARIEAYDPADLDAVTGAGEVAWLGVEPLGDRDGRVALYLADRMAALLPPSAVSQPAPAHAADGQLGREPAILGALRTGGASFFSALHETVGGGYPADTVAALWNLVWQGLVTNDTFHALREFTRPRGPRRRSRRERAPGVRSRRLVPASAEGRWSLVAEHRSTPTRWVTAIAEQLLARHGVVTREAVASENLPGGFSTVYAALKAMEEAGRLRRGYFVAGLGATQFALPGALDLLRSLRETPEVVELVALAATDPANPYGSTLRWPQATVVVASGRSPTRTVGATVYLVDGALGAYLSRGDRQLATFLPEADPQRTRVGRSVARALIARARAGQEAPRGMLIEEIDGLPPAAHPLACELIEAGFVPGARGLQATFPRQR